MAKEKMPFELARPDANTPVTNATEIDYGSGSSRVPLAEKINNMPETRTSVSSSDFSIADENGNTILQIDNEGLKVKEFQSKKTPSVSDMAGEWDFAISDTHGNVILCIKEGNIRTKKFNSDNIKVVEVVNNPEGKKILKFL